MDPTQASSSPTATLSIAEALMSAAANRIDRLDAHWMLAKLVQQPRAWLIAHDEALLTAAQAEQYAYWLGRRQAGEPLAYLLGEKDFYGLPLQVDPQVLIPRPDTEPLVEWGLVLLTGMLSEAAAPRVVDLGTGSGAIALAIKHHCTEATVTGVDISAPALQVARRNAEALGLNVALAQGHWWSTLGRQQFDLALSNPPYIAPGDKHLAALRHEPQGALVSGDNGLSDLYQIIDGAADHLAIGGWLLLEHGHDQADAVRHRLSAAGFESVQTRRDLAGHERCSGGQLRRDAMVR